jgi:riboflavin kinase/FMN adenylyltransferase
MTVVTWSDFLSGKRPRTEAVNLTVGVFDGVHLGHRRLLSEVTGRRGLSLVVTFVENPAYLLSRDGFQGSILTFRQKMERFEALSVDFVVAIDFSEQLSRLSGKAFIGLLRENLTIKKIAVGFNFRFGRGRDTDADALRKMFRGSESEVSVAEPVLYDGSAVSSSRIRACIGEGAFRDAREMLGTGHCLDLRDVPAASDTLGDNRIKSIRKSDIRQCLPAAGSYPVSCEAETAVVSGLLTIHEDFVKLELESGGKITSARFLSDEERSPPCL